MHYSATYWNTNSSYVTIQQKYPFQIVSRNSASILMAQQIKVYYFFDSKNCDINKILAKLEAITLFMLKPIKQHAVKIPCLIRLFLGPKCF